MAERKTVHPLSESSSRRRRSLLPRFGLRTAFVFAVLFCLALAWIGRGLYRVRQEEAALEALMRADCAVVLDTGGWRDLHPATPGPGSKPVRDSWREILLRAVGWSERPAIREVTLHGDDPDDPALDLAIASLALFSEIRSIDLREGPAFDDEALDAIAKLPRLEKLSMHDPAVSVEGLRRVARTTKLRELSISKHEVAGGEGLASAVASFRDLRQLDLESVRLARRDMEKIAALPHLERLRVSHVMLADRQENLYAPLSSATRLKSFYVAASGFGDVDLRTVAKLPALESLWVENVSDDSLARMEPSPRLRSFTIYGPATAEAAKVFSAQHPAIEVGWRIENSDGRSFRGGRSNWEEAAGE